MTSPQVGILTGVTAAGKTAAALELARRHGSIEIGIEIINADSMLVYRGMDIGTAKPTPRERAEIPHHLIDLREPTAPYTAADFVRDAGAAISDIESRGKRALIVGGTGFYLKALLHGLWDAPPTDPLLRAELEQLDTPALRAELVRADPEACGRIGAADRYRLVRAIEVARSGRKPSILERERPRDPDPRFALWIVDRADQELRERIAARTRAMLDQGLIDEVRRLLSAAPGSRALDSVGYAETVAHLEGRPPQGRKIPPGLDGLRSEIELGTRQLVKRQRTWFKGQHPYATWFTLDQGREDLDRAFLALYGSDHFGSK